LADGNTIDPSSAARDGAWSNATVIWLLVAAGLATALFSLGLVVASGALADLLWSGLEAWSSRDDPQDGFLGFLHFLVSVAIFFGIILALWLVSTVVSRGRLRRAISAALQSTEVETLTRSMVAPFWYASAASLVFVSGFVGALAFDFVPGTLMFGYLLPYLLNELILGTLAPRIRQRAPVFWSAVERRAALPMGQNPMLLWVGCVAVLPLAGCLFAL
jgi:hypothetical protein